MDIWGPISIPSMFGHKYFLTIVDDFTRRYTWLILMKTKAKTSMHLQGFATLVETQFNTRIKCIRSDNGKEFLLTTFFCSKHQTTCVETSQQNGVVEGKHQHILEVARALLFQASLPKFFWNFAVTHAIFLINRQPSSSLKNHSPYHTLHNAHPDLSNLRVFGSLCYASTLQSHIKSWILEPKSAFF